MKKSEIKIQYEEQICELQKEKRDLQCQIKEWKQIAASIIYNLSNHGVLMEIKEEEPELVDVRTSEDAEPRYKNGIQEGVKKVIFDFTNHDLEVVKKHLEEQP